MFNKLHTNNNTNMATHILFACCASLIILSLNPKVVLASGSSPVREQPGGHEQVQPVFIPGSEQDIQSGNSDLPQESSTTIDYDDSNSVIQYINTQCPSENICADDRVIDKSNKLGTVTEVFSNGQAFVDFDDYSTNYSRDVSSLGKAVRCFKGICVGSRVIDAANKAGKVLEVFDSAQAMVKFDDYSTSYVRDVSRLAVSVSR